jgi:hypothetical protein
MMRRAWAAAACVGLALPVGAHRVSDMLQTVFVRCEADRVEVEWVGLPGATSSRALVRLLDQDADGKVADDERERFARLVASKVRARMDGRRLGPGPVEASIPPIDMLRAGNVPVRLRWSLPVLAPTAGSHRAEVFNGFRALDSVYLCGAVVPESPGVRVLGQERDRRQRRLTVRFDVEVPASSLLPGPPP